VPVLNACRTCGKPTDRPLYCREHRGDPVILARAGGRPGRGTVADRELTRLVIERDGGICSICGQPGADSKHHSPVPYSKGGKTVLSNLKAAHRRCNSREGAKVHAKVER
jgi:5-methylcytosine-specific restriction endonuclease McrA